MRNKDRSKNMKRKRLDMDSTVPVSHQWPSKSTDFNAKMQFEKGHHIHQLFINLH